MVLHSVFVITFVQSTSPIEICSDHVKISCGQFLLPTAFEYSSSIDSPKCEFLGILLSFPSTLSELSFPQLFASLFKSDFSKHISADANCLRLRTVTVHFRSSYDRQNLATALNVIKCTILRYIFLLVTFRVTLIT